jgi:hypothetical protein
MAYNENDYSWRYHLAIVSGESKVTVRALSYVAGDALAQRIRTLMKLAPKDARVIVDNAEAAISEIDAGLDSQVVDLLARLADTEHSELALDLEAAIMGSIRANVRHAETISHALSLLRELMP